MLIYTTNNRTIACLALSDNIAKRCCLSAGHTELHLGDERTPLLYLLSPRSGGWPMVLREDQLIYVESRENVFFYDMGPLILFRHTYFQLFNCKGQLTLLGNGLNLSEDKLGH